MSNYIPVVLAADNNYAYPLITTIYSALVNKKETNKYKFYLCLSKDFAEEHILKINELLKQYNCPNVTCIFFNKEYSDIDMKIQHITTATYYRLSLPELLETENKVVYLDVDILVRQDLNELLETLDDDHLISGVKAAGYYYPQENLQKKAEILGIDKFDQYVNAGVLVMNLALMRAENLQERFMTLIDKNFDSQDQDIINSACYGKITILPPKYNAMTKYNLQIANSYNNLPCLELVYSKQEWDEACIDPVIIHYADKIKPWEDFSSDYAEEWWLYAKDAGVHEQVFSKFLSIIAEKSKTKKYENLQEVRTLKNKVEEHRVKQNEYKQELLNERKKVEYLEREIEELKLQVKSGLPFKVITYIPTKICGGIRCYKEHGLRYTLKRIGEKINSK